MIKSYYQDKYCTIYHGDCLEIVPQLEPVDLVLTSPPYNLGNNHHTSTKRHYPYNDNMPEEEYQTWQAEILSLLFDICLGDCFYNHQHRIKKGKLLKPDTWINRTKWEEKQEIVWNRGSPNMDSCRFYPFTERIYWLTKQATTSIFRNIHNLTDDWHVKPVGISKKHTRTFPIIIPKRLISCTNAVVILDPFMGSGTTLVAAKQLNRKAIGIEIEEKYCEIAIRRLAQEVLEWTP